MIENTKNRTWGVTERQRQLDVVDAIIEAKEAGIEITARNVPGIYAQARKAFGSWADALEAAGQPVRVNQSYKPADRQIDVVSPWPCPGLPEFMRERQIVGGRMLELIAESLHRSGFPEHPIQPEWTHAALIAALNEWKETAA